MTRDEAIEILKAIYFLDEKKQKALNMAIESLEREGKKCGECKWLCGNESTVGIACLHPDRPFYLLACDTAKFKYKSTRACKRFERKEEDDDIH